MSDRHIDDLIFNPNHPVISADRPRDGSAKGDSSLMIRALLLILGGLAIVSYAMMSLPGMDG